MQKLVTIRLALQILALTLTASLLSAAPRAQDEIDPAKYAKVKAGMVLNFVRYTTWPGEAFNDTDETRAPIVITIVGRDDMQDDLLELVEDVEVGGRQIEVRQIERPQPDPRTREIDQAEIDAFHAKLRNSHLLFIARTERDRFYDLLEVVEESEVLTVSDIEEFAYEGGMLGLAVRRGRVAFDANTGEIEESKVSVSSKVLRLGEVVKTRRRS